MPTTNLFDFKKDFLARARQLLIASDLSSATDAEIITRAALVKSYDAVNLFNPVDVDALGGLVSMSAAEFELLFTNIDGRREFDLIISSPVAMRAIAANQSVMSLLLNSSAAMTAVAASSTAMTAILASPAAMSALVASPTAMTAVLANSTAWSAVLASSAAMSTLVASPTAMTAVAASSAAMSTLVASPTAMTAVAASSVAMSAVAASSTAMAAVNSSVAAMDSLYASPLITKTSYSAMQLWGNTVTIRAGITLFVRLTTRAGWTSGSGEGSTGLEWMTFDGVQINYAERSASSYNHTALTSSPRLPLRRCASSLQIHPAQACEVAFIALSA